MVGSLIIKGLELSRLKQFNLTPFWVLAFFMLSGCATLINPSLAKEEIKPTTTVSPTDTSVITATRITKTYASTATLLPAQSPRPTRTPQDTPTVTATRTPLPFSSGPLQIGLSAAGRPINVYRFGTGPSERLIAAGIHGGYEWNTIKLAYQLIEHFDQNPDSIPTGITLFILPVLNPDGEARGHGPKGRANENNVDLNRNFPSGWLIDWERSGCWQEEPITAGSYPLSEPEAMALAKFVQGHRIEALISYHSAGLGVYPGGKQSDTDSINLAKAISSVSPFFYPPFDTGCQYTGMLADYAVDIGISAVDLELSTHWDTEFEANLTVMQVFLSWESNLEGENSPP